MRRTLVALCVGMLLLAIGTVKSWLEHSLDHSIDEVVKRLSATDRSPVRVSVRSPVRVVERADPPSFDYVRKHLSADGWFDETLAVPLKTVVPSPCIAVSFTHLLIWNGQPYTPATVFLAKPEPKVRPDAWKNEEERLALIEALNIQALLALLPSSPDEAGCFNIDNDKLASGSGGGGSAEGYVFAALEHGTAVVKDTDTGEFVSHINVRYFSGRLSGDIFVYLPGKTRPLITSVWWVS